MDNPACAGAAGEFEEKMYTAGKHVVFGGASADTLSSIVREQMTKLNSDEVKAFRSNVNACSLSRHPDGFIVIGEIKLGK